MKFLISILLIIAFLAIFFFKSTLIHRISYIVFLIWFFGIEGNLKISNDVKFILQKHPTLNILYWLFFILLFIYCVIGIIEAFLRIFFEKFTFETYIKNKYSSYLENKRMKLRAKPPGQLDVHSLFPQIQESGEYEYIYNQCKDMEERAQFIEDWNRYLIDLQVLGLSALIDGHTKDCKELYYSFGEWFDRHQLWKVSEYYHSKYEEKNPYTLSDTNLDIDFPEVTSCFSLKSSFWDGSLEPKIYLALKKIIHTDYIILPHIGLREVFYWKWDNDWKFTNKVTKMHFDFAIYTNDFLPVVFFEINGGEHNKQQIKLNDEFKHFLVAQNKLKLITIDATFTIQDEKLEEIISTQIKVEIPDRQSYPAYCPGCQYRMSLRQNHQTKEYFYSCYKCNKTYSLSVIPPLYEDIVTDIERKNTVNKEE